MTQKEALNLYLQIPEDIRTSNSMINMRSDKSCYVGFYNMTGSQAVKVKVYLEDHGVDFDFVEFHPIGDKENGEGIEDTEITSYNIIINGNN